MADWSCEHSIYTRASRAEAWRYWSDMRNHARLEPDVLRIELDGPFAAGTTGRTIAKDFTQELELTEVLDGERFVITGYTPDGKGALSFTWEFEDDDGGTRITQRISAYGPDVEHQTAVFRQMEENAPVALARLAVELDQLVPKGGRA